MGDKLISTLSLLASMADLPLFEFEIFNK